MASFVYQFIDQHAQKSPEAVALTLKSSTLTYGELHLQVKHFASAITQLGLTRYDRVGIYLHKTMETVVSIFGTNAASGVFVPINPVLKGPQVNHIVNDCDIKFLITNRGRLNSIKHELANMPSLKAVIIIDDDASNYDYTAFEVVSWPDIMSNQSNALPAMPKTADDMAAILYTSGSTGKPKGVVLSHNNLVQGAISVATYLENDSEDVILSVLPLSFDYGLSQLTTAFYVGASCVLLDYLLANDVVKTIERFGVTGVACVPPLWSQLCALNWSENAGNSVRYFTNSGGALTTTNLKQLQSLMPNAKPYLMYGLTEAFRSTYLPPEEVESRPTSMGKAIPNAEVMVVRPDGTECQPEEAGELVHRGPLVSLGYWNAKEKTEQRFKPAPGQPEGIINPELAVWSGDTVKKDKEGFLYFVSRTDEMIKTSGYRVSPMEIEEILYQFKGVAEAVALGIKHEQLGQAILVIACFSHNDPDQTKPLMQHCQKLLANYMVPKDIIVLDNLPHNANGKIDRAYLNKHYKNYYTE